MEGCGLVIGCNVKSTTMILKILTLVFLVHCSLLLTYCIVTMNMAIIKSSSAVTLHSRWWWNLDKIQSLSIQSHVDNYK